MIKIIIADDQQLIREGLRLVLENAGGMTICGEAKNGSEVLDLVLKEKPDVVVTDIQMPDMDGIALTRALAGAYPEIKMIGLTMYEEEHLVVDMLEAGAKGYLMKTADTRKLIDAIQAVHSHGWYFCESTSLKLMKKIAGSPLPLSLMEHAGAFTATEKEIIRLVCDQLSSKEIGERLHLGLKTVESYRTRIFDKMGVKNMAGLVIYAIRAGLYHP